MSIFPKLTYRLKIPAGFFPETEKVILKLIWKCKGLPQELRSFLSATSWSPRSSESFVFSRQIRKKNAS